VAGVSIADVEVFVSDVRALEPVTEEDYERVRDYIVASRGAWERDLAYGLGELTGHLAAAGYVTSLADQRSDAMAGDGKIDAGEAVVSGRLKQTEAVVAKMRRYGEPLRVMLDVWGYRVVVASDGELDAAAECCAQLWETPTRAEMLLRHGQLQFDWWRDYRLRSHAGLSAATTAHYDQAIHLNRRAAFGIVEIQVLTFGLYRRVHCDRPATTATTGSWPAGRPCFGVMTDDRGGGLSRGTRDPARRAGPARG
jgi:hypothetical protein